MKVLILFALSSTAYWPVPLIGHLEQSYGDIDVAWCDANISVEFSPGVVIDPHSGTAYIMNPDGGIDAVEVTSGKLLWISQQAAKPLLLHRDLLIAQVDASPQCLELRIVVLNTSNNGAVVHEYLVPISQGVRAVINNQLGTSFSVHAHIQNDDVIISWESRKQPNSHFGTSLNGLPAICKNSGVSKIDLQTGSVDKIRSEELHDAHKFPLPDNVGQLIKSGKLHGTPWRAGNVLAYISHSPNDASQFVLHRWHYKTGESLPTVTLYDDERKLRERSVDGRHIIASRPAEASDQVATVYVWYIFSLETGELIAKVANQSPSGRFLIIGSTMLEMQSRSKELITSKWVDHPLRLRATAINTNILRWERPVRDTAYRGPYPSAKK